MSVSPARKRAALARAVAKMERQAGRSQVYALELFSPHAGIELLAGALAGDGNARQRLEVIGAVLSRPPPCCSACGEPLGFPVAIGLLRPAREVADGKTQALALACCSACAAEGEAALRRKLFAWLDARSLDPTHPPPGAVQ